MKKILSYFQKNFVAVVLLLCNITIVPGNLGLSHYDIADVKQDELNTTVTNPGEDEEEPAPPEDQTDPEDPDDTEEELFDFETDLIIKAINPGYTIDKISNVGEFIELQNLADVPIALAGYKLVYTNSSGNTGLVFTFPENSYMTGKRLLLRYYKSPEAEKADLNYKGTGLAMSAGPLQLVYDEEVVDEVCWNGKDNCHAAFQNTKTMEPTYRATLVRSLASGEFEYVYMEDYEPEYDADESNYIEIPEEEEEEEKLPPQCQGLEFSEILSYYVDSQAEQFIEFFNPTALEIKLDGCKINFKKKEYDLTGVVSSGKYFAFYLDGAFALTKNPSNPLTLTLIDVNGDAVDEMAYGSGQKKSTSYAKIFDESGNDSWQVTYAITPNVENIYQKYRSCEEGKIINEATGNCVKVSLVAGASATLTPCPEGQYRNPLTNRCKKIETSTSGLAPCADGYERNPETNRCRKITTPNEGADYALVPSTRSDKTIFIGIGVVSIIVILGLTYVGLQFRHEIARAARVTGQRLDRVRKDLLARCFGRDRNKKP